MSEALPFLRGGGDCGALARSVDWAATPLGPAASWQASLKTVVSVLLQSRHPMFLWWGPSLTQVYNDAYVPSFGRGKHPAAMGQGAKECWSESWPLLAPQIEDVMVRGTASWNDDRLVPIERNGRLEEVYWTYGYSPVFDDAGDVGGTLVVCTETTRRVVAERRLELLRSLMASLAAAVDTDDVFRRAAVLLGAATHDIPWLLFRGRERPSFGVGLDPSSTHEVERQVDHDSIRSGPMAVSSPCVVAPWPEPVTDAFVLPLDAASSEHVVFGLSPRLSFDEAYALFLGQIGEQLGQSLSRSRLEVERRNLLEQAPVATAIMLGPDHVFDQANPLYREMVGGRELLGKSYVEAFPELRETALPGILDRVYRLGEPFVTHELPVSLAAQGNGPLEELFFKFNLEPIRNAEGVVYGMMAVAVDITASVRARRVMEEAQAERERLLLEAESAGRAKDEFLAMLGHELRNPLHPMLTAVDLLKMKAGESPTRELDIIERQARHMTHLVDDLLDVARVARGKIDLRRARVAMADVVARAAEVVGSLYVERGHTLDLLVPETGFDVDGDATRLSQVVANLLTNAARYTEPGGRVTVSIARDGGDVLLRVTDNGRGITPEHLPHVFELFFQGPRDRARADGGLGLGLTLVKNLVELHGGSVSVRSEGVGRGSELTVRLPLAPDASTPASPAAPSPAPAAAGGTRVLLVDDNEDATELCTLALEMAGFEVQTAHDGARALVVAAAFRPHVAVLDIGLPGMDGYELAGLLREQLADAAPLLIAMTGYGTASDRERSRRAGFDVHLVKPVDIQGLVGAVTRARAR